MEFEVRIVGGERCFVSLPPLSLIQTLQSGYLPPVLALELRLDARHWHVAWCGSASTSPSSIEGSGKSLSVKASAKYIEGCKDILAHIVFVSCSRLALEKSSTIHKALSSYVSEALDHSPSVVTFDDLDSIIAPSSDFEGSQFQTSSAALIEFFTDIFDEYEENRSMCGIDPIAFIATFQSLTGVPHTLISSGRFDFHVKLVVPAAAECSAILKYEIQKRSLQCSDDLLLDIASISACSLSFISVKGSDLLNKYF